MLASEIRELTDDDIRARLAELEEERFRLRFRGATETLENPLRLRFLRRDVARLKTILHERTLGAGAAPAGGGGAAAPRPAAKRASAKRAAGTQAAKKTTARKSAAKKGATKKSPAKKAAAKKAG